MVDAIKNDPAFDYLKFANKAERLVLKSPRDVIELQRLDAYIAGRRNVLFVNLRPLWDAYISNNQYGAVDAIDALVSEKISELLNGLSADWAVVICPFNPDTYGFSDFSSFSKVIRKLNFTRDHYVIEYEPGIAVMLQLLAKCSHVLAMRFHACIFAFSRNINVYGLDYQVGGKGKVANLFEEQGSDNWSNICAIDVERIRTWLDSSKQDTEDQVFFKCAPSES
jgi:polysaccharide pyruvyl transferase WcaK-like protein